MPTPSAPGVGLRPGFEAALDAVAATACSGAAAGGLAVPGCVVHARRGPYVYTKAHGFADLESRTPLEADAMIRFYSMTKVQTCTVCAMMYERGWLRFTDPRGR